MRRLSGLGTGVGREMRPVASHEAEQHVLLVDELVARVVRRRVGSGVHANGIAGACLDAVAAEDAPQLVDDELHGVALVAAPSIPLRVLAGLDEDALRRARRGATETGDATRALVFTFREPVHTAEP